LCINNFIKVERFVRKHEITESKMIRVPLLNQGEEKKFVEVKEDQLPTNVSQIANFLDKE